MEPYSLATNINFMEFSSCYKTWPTNHQHKHATKYWRIKLQMVRQFGERCCLLSHNTTNNKHFHLRLPPKTTRTEKTQDSVEDFKTKYVWRIEGCHLKKSAQPCPRVPGLLSSHLESQAPKRSQKGQKGFLVCSPASTWAIFNEGRPSNSKLPQVENSWYIQGVGLAVYKIRDHTMRSGGQHGQKNTDCRQMDLVWILIPPLTSLVLLCNLLNLSELYSYLSLKWG